MPLPDVSLSRSLEWPPPHVTKYVRQAREWGAWWSGDVDLLRRYSAERRYWHRQAATDSRRPNVTQARSMHTALAADIVTTSADLLFGDRVAIAIPVPEATGDAGERVDTDAEGLAAGDASLAQERAAVDVTQARLDELREELDLDGRLLEAGEVAAALGGAWLRPAWNKAVADHPLLTIVDPEFAVPEYRMGELVAVTFWEQVGGESADSGRVWRHLERHEAVRSPLGVVSGVILHGLYLGDRDTLGKPQALVKHAATATLEEVVEVPEAAGPIMPAYMPNVLPNRRSRKLPIGRSDFDGVEDGLDALDEVWSSLLRDIRLGVARLIVPEGTLERTAPGVGAGKSFDVDRELMVETDAAPDEQGGRVTMTQASIRDASHLATIRALTEAVVSAAGYAPATFGLGIDGRAESGTARQIRERKTFRTLARKRRYAARAIVDVVHALLAIDAEVFERDIVPMRPRVGWSDVTAEPRATAERLQLLRAAQAMSITAAVREAQPDLDETEVEAEVAAILRETGGFADPDTAHRAGSAFGEPDDLDDPDDAAA